MNFLVDHNLRGHSVVLAGSFTASGWLDLIEIWVQNNINYDNTFRTEKLHGLHRREN